MVVEKYLLCPENFFGMSGKFCRMFVYRYVRKIFFLRNINVQFACSGKLYCAPPNKIGPYADTPMLRRELTSLKKSKFSLNFSGSCISINPSFLITVVRTRRLKDIVIIAQFVLVPLTASHKYELSRRHKRGIFNNYSPKAR